MVDTAHHPSRRTIVKAGLWAAPTIAVVNLTSMSAAHASVISACIPSHGILVYAVPVSGGSFAYYAFKFGVGTAQPFADVEQNPNDLGSAFLTAYSPLIGSAKDANTPASQPNEWSSLQTIITSGLYLYSDLNGQVVGYAYSAPTIPGATLVGAAIFNGGSVTPLSSITTKPLIFTVC